MDGGEATQLTTAGKDSAPKVSPDGKWILFASKRDVGEDDKGNGLYVLPTDGGRRVSSCGARKESRVMRGPRTVGASSSCRTSDRTTKTFGRSDVSISGSNEKGFVYNLRKHVFALDVKTKETKQVTKASST